jgi:predicted ATPase
LLTLFLAQVPTTRLLAVFTYRQEFTPPWGSHSYLSQLTLSRLGRNHVQTMVEKVTGGKALPQEVVQQIVNKTDGVPLFVEEMTKSVIESIGSVEFIESGRKLGQSSLQLGIPATLQDALMARLDRLGPAKEIPQIGATIGREFNYDLLRAVSLLNDEAFQQGLKQLVEAELVFQSGVPPHARYLFKHTLVQDTAYQSLLKSRRQQLHQTIGKVLEQQFPETKETHPELIAHHYTEAGLPAQAILYWQQAGQRAIQRSAYVEAVAHVTKGMELLQTLPDTPARVEQELALQVALGTALMATKGYAAVEVEQAFGRARELCRQVGETPQLFPILRGLQTFYVVRAELHTAQELGEDAISLARSVQNPAFLTMATLSAGVVCILLGEFSQGRTHLEEGISLYDPVQHHSHASLFGEDVGISCLSWITFALWSLGYPEQALKRMDQALTLAQDLSHPFSLGYALTCAAHLHQCRREEQVTQARAERLLALGVEHGFALRIAQGPMLRGWAQAMQGHGEEGIAQLRQGLETFRAIGAEFLRPTYLALLAEAQGKVGQAEEGLTTLAEALVVLSKTAERYYEAELYRLKGMLTLEQANQKAKGKGQKAKIETDPQPLNPDPQGEAEACFLKAIEIACRQQAKSWELRATTSLARLWQQQGKAFEAHDMLSEIYDWFTEGFDTKDLQEAEALIEELSH